MELKDKPHCRNTLDCRLTPEAAEQRGERVMQICHGIEYPTNTPRVVHNPNIVEAHTPTFLWHRTFLVAW